MVTIYQFRVWDHAAGEMKTQPLKSPEERITRVGGEIIEGTAEEVPEGALDAEGRYDPLRFHSGAYGAGAFGEVPFGGGGTFERTALDGGTFQTAADPAKVASGEAPAGRVSLRGPAARGEAGVLASSIEVGVQGVSATGSAGSFVPDLPQAATEPSNEVNVTPAAAVVAHDVPTEVLTGADTVRINAEHLRRQQAAVAAATSGSTEPLSPPFAGTILQAREQPQAGTAPAFSFDADRSGFDEGQWSVTADAGQAGTAPTMADLSLSDSVAVGDTQEGGHVARMVVASFSQRRDAIAISVATFRSLLDVRAQQLAEALRERNDPETIAELKKEIAEVESLQRQALEVQSAAVDFADDPAKREAAVTVSVSFVQGLKNWWTEKHISICDSTFKTSLFLAGAGVSYALGIPMLGAGVCGVLTGGEPVAKVLQAKFAKGKD